MQTSQRGLALIMGNEGFSATVYPDAGQEAIGYGHDLLPGESYPEGITREEARALLAQDVGKVENAVNSLGWPLNQNQFDALIDFGFNLGIGALQTLCGHGIENVPEQIPRWNHCEGVVSAALTARRASEVALWNTNPT
jgi:lysozyme